MIDYIDRGFESLDRGLDIGVGLFALGVAIITFPIWAPVAIVLWLLGHIARPR